MWDSLRTNKGLNNCSCVNCEDCPLSLFDGCTSAEDIFDIYKTVEKWSKEHPQKKYKVSKLEYDILKYLSDNTTLMYITRSKYGNVYLFNEEPKKSSFYWYGNGTTLSVAVFNKLFQFVQWEDEKPTSIQEVLKNCEVMDDDTDKR